VRGKHYRILVDPPEEQGEQLMTNNIVKHCLCGCMYLETDCPNCNKITDADTITALRAEVERLTAAWAYCPECGSQDLHHEEGEHKQCAKCYQEWFSDIDYSEVVRANLEVMSRRAERAEVELAAARAARTVKVKPLVWERHPMGWIAGAMFGPAYIIDVRIKGRVLFVKGINPSPQFEAVDAAKAAAQADYEARILAALTTKGDTDERA
jgi:hypothetical protein